MRNTILRRHLVNMFAGDAPTGGATLDTVEGATGETTEVTEVEDAAVTEDEDSDDDDSADGDDDEPAHPDFRKLRDSLRKKNSENRNLRKAKKAAEAKAAENADQAKRVPELERENLYLRVALENGIPLEIAERLRGETAEELTEDAEKLLSFFTPDGPPSGTPKERVRKRETASEEREETVDDIAKRMFRNNF